MSLLVRSILTGTLFLLAACGSDGRGAASGGGGGDVTWPEREGGASTTLPRVVRTGRVVFQSESGESCCVALDPTLLSGDGSPGLAVLDDLPAGPATVTVTGFATDFAPSVPDVTATCTAIPASAAMPCDPILAASPAFASDPLFVDIIAGVQTNLGQIAMKALPFVFDFRPIQDEETMEPVGFDFTVVDAVTNVGSASVGLEVRFEVEDPVVATPVPSQTPERPSFRLVSKRIPIRLSPCADDSETPCSNDNLGLAGFTATGEGVNMPSGVVEARITAMNEGDPPQPMDFRYPFTILPTPTPGGGA